MHKGQDMSDSGAISIWISVLSIGLSERKRDIFFSVSKDVC